MSCPTCDATMNALGCKVSGDTLPALQQTGPRRREGRREVRLPFSAEVEAGRLPKTGSLYDSSPGDDFGAFALRCPATRATVKAIAAAGTGWDDVLAGPVWEHVSVSLKDRCPTWAEMCFVKDLFWGPEECVIQFHPPRSSYVNCHPFVLHLWKPVGITLPMPPLATV